MILEKYPIFKDSGVEWLGEIPHDWEIIRIKDYSYLKARIGWQGLRSDEFQDKGEYYCITGTDFEKGKINWKNAYFVSKERYDQDKYIQLKVGDLLITKDGTIGKLAIVEEIIKPATLNTGVFVSRPLKNKYLTKYLYWVLSSDVFINFIEPKKYGSTIQHLYQNVFLFFSFPAPTIRIQEKIVVFLDIKTSQIDRKIKLLQDKKISYEEFKKSLINETVCRGINKNVELKDSGIEWIRKIPKTWSVDRMKNRFILKKKKVGEFSKNYKLLSLTQNGVVYRDVEGGFGKFPAEFNSYQIVEKDDLIFCLFDMDVTPRTIGYSNYFGMITGAYTILKSKKGCNKYYYYLYLMADISKKLSFCYTGLRNTIRKEKFFTLEIPVPPVSEQIQITKYLDEKTSKIDEIISKIKDQITTLTEFRKTLINDVVTGKVRVQND